MNKLIRYQMDFSFFFKIYYTTLTYEEQTEILPPSLKLCDKYYHLLRKILNRPYCAAPYYTP